MKKATDKQIDYLLKLGYKKETANLSAFQAHLLIDEYKMLNERQNVPQTAQNEPKTEPYTAHSKAIYYKDAEKLLKEPLTVENGKAFCDKYDCDIYF